MPKNLNPVNSSQTMVIPSRDGALAQLESFLERVPSYEKNRSYDRPGHADVSQLSRWIRYRVVTEGECIERVLSRYPFAMAEKFIQEVVWRTYWKGWLEMHPGVWARFVSDRERLIERYRDDEGLHAAYAGRTSLIFFNDWVRELIDTGYLHNHTRMWFASVWIFTLRLPWQLGAAFMYRHLLDGDPASNTLSWRWVGGLHTRGKIYVAKPGNIRTYSEGRWNPKEGELAVDPAPLPFEEPDGVAPFRKVEALSPSSDSLVLLHDDDLSADLSSEFSSKKLTYLLLEVEREHQSAMVKGYVDALRQDTTRRTGGAVVRSAEDIAILARARGSREIHAMVPTLGFEHATVMAVAAQLEVLGISIVWHRRGWDYRFMPRASRGFFPFWEGVRGELQAVGVA